MRESSLNNVGATKSFACWYVSVVTGLLSSVSLTPLATQKNSRCSAYALKPVAATKKSATVTEA